MILPQHLPEWLTAGRAQGEIVAGPLTLQEMERRAIIETLRRNDYRKMKTCRELGISKDTLRRKIAAYNIQDVEHRGVKPRPPGPGTNHENQNCPTHSVHLGARGPLGSDGDHHHGGLPDLEP